MLFGDVRSRVVEHKVISIKHNDQKGAAISSFRLSLLIISGTALILWYLIWSKPEPEVDLQEIAPLKVITTQVMVRDISPYERVTGRLQPTKTAKLRFQVAGVVLRREIEPGYRVEQGQALLALDARDYRDELIQCEAALLIEQQTQARDRQLLQLASKNLALQEQELNRIEQIAAKNLIAQSAVDSARQQVFDLRAELARLQASDTMSQARIMQQQSLYDVAQRNLQR
ncbi:MAG: biotin/lipoyl-binding protein, partial [Candidatus Thioglobus sp.]